MIRILIFLAILAALVAGFGWLAERPGTVSVVWLGQRIETSITVLLVTLLALAAVAVLFWSLVTGLFRLPKRLRAGAGRRRRERGWRALSDGMVAVGSGDTARALRQSSEARRFLADEPLALLLEAQAAQLAGDREGAARAFERMTAEPGTRLLGLRGLYVEAQRHGDAEAARHFAAEAAREAPQLPWAGNAQLEFQAQARDWTGALATLDANARHRLIGKDQARRLKAVLLTARALELEGGDPDKARQCALEAHAIAPGLVPAATAAARLLARGGDVRKASRVLEAAWKAAPHPDIATAYVFVRPGDSVQERLKRARDLVALRTSDPAADREGRLALARAALDARDFRLARDTLSPLVAAGPTRRVCLLVAEIEEAEHGDAGRVREWLARAVRAPRDPTWVADGFVSDEWAPVSPVSGKLDAFVWTVPPERIAAPMSDPIDEVREVVDEAGALTPLEAPRAPPPAEGDRAGDTPPARIDPGAPVPPPHDDGARRDPATAATPETRRITPTPPAAPAAPAASPAAAVGAVEPEPSRPPPAAPARAAAVAAPPPPPAAAAPPPPAPQAIPHTASAPAAGHGDGVRAGATPGEPMAGSAAAAPALDTGNGTAPWWHRDTERPHRDPPPARPRRDPGDRPGLANPETQG